ncbi:MAG: DUF6712 family protein [Bacteroidota bacterium]
MALFKNTAEIAVYLPVVSTTDFDSLLPFINEAERDYIIPKISQTQYNDLSVAYNVATPSLTGPQTQLLARCRAALSQYFFYLWIPTGQLSIGDNGIRIAVTDTLKTAFPWQIDNLERSVMKSAGRAMDHLLEYMEANKSSYALWTASSSYTEFKECFITTTKRFTALYGPLGNSHLNFLAIRSAMLKAQDFDIAPEIGEAFYNELMVQHIAGTVSPQNAFVIERIQKALAPLTMKRAITEMSVTIDERGILNFDNTTGGQTVNSKMPAKDPMILKLETACEVDGRAYIQKLKDFLKANISTYTTYANSSAYDSAATNSDLRSDSADTIFDAF